MEAPPPGCDVETFEPGTTLWLKWKPVETHAWVADTLSALQLDYLDMGSATAYGKIEVLNATGLRISFCKMADGAANVLAQAAVQLTKTRAASVVQNILEGDGLATANCRTRDRANDAAQRCAATGNCGNQVLQYNIFPKEGRLLLKGDHPVAIVLVGPQEFTTARPEDLPQECTEAWVEQEGIFETYLAETGEEHRFAPAP